MCTVVVVAVVAVVGGKTETSSSYPTTQQLASHFSLSIHVCVCASARRGSVDDDDSRH